MLVASFAFATMGVCVKLGSAFFTSGEMVFYRGVIGAICMALWAKIAGVSLKTSVPKMHVLRSGLGVVSLCAWFYAIAHLHVATAITLNYMSSVWLATFLVGGALWRGKNKSNAAQHGLQSALVTTVLIGFAGVVFILRPEFEHGQELAGVVGLLSGIVAAVAYMQVSKLARAGESEIRIVFYFAVGTLLAGLLSMAITGVSAWPAPETHGVLWLVCIGVLASIGQVCMTKAYGSGATLLVANLQYMGIVYAALYGLFIFGDPLPPTAWLGMALIIICGITAAILRSKTIPAHNKSNTPTPAEEF